MLLRLMHTQSLQDRPKRLNGFDPHTTTQVPDVHTCVNGDVPPVQQRRLVGQHLTQAKLPTHVFHRWITASLGKKLHTHIAVGFTLLLPCDMGDGSGTLPLKGMIPVTKPAAMRSDVDS
ncbi:hypothetical protein E2C01_000495 [Portunus trituberculatus]|uniref:Uncharacterized protein n=1 Tax=Portunus trituberculatus TaxID=210409 RepID=A0A5B7CF42_PORTR|nr:hypothetical protein [Portunus trituberculatus]